MKRALLIFIVFSVILVSFGCLAYDVRQELPTTIEVTEKPVAAVESPIVCQQASCLAIVKDVDQKKPEMGLCPAVQGRK